MVRSASRAISTSPSRHRRTTSIDLLPRCPTSTSAAMLASGDQWHLVTDYGRLDVVTLPAHLGSFADLRARAHDVALGDVSVPIAHRDDLLRMKRASGRPQDLLDVQLLESLGDEP
jgi:hypothetical protein